MPTVRAEEGAESLARGVSQHHASLSLSLSLASGSDPHQPARPARMTEFGAPTSAQEEEGGCIGSCVVREGARRDRYAGG